MKKALNILYIILFFSVLTGCFAFSVVSGKDINQYENRKAEKMPLPVFSEYIDSSFQSRLENALSDQLPFSENLKKAYNDINSKYVLSYIEPISENMTDKYVRFGDLRIFGGDSIVYWTRTADSVKNELDHRIDNMNTAVDKHHFVQFYLYYIEKDTDIDFENNEKSGVFEYIKENCHIYPENMSKFEINSFDEYKDFFYRSDHHWNCKGSYKGYTEVLELLDCGDTPLIPYEKVETELTFSGSKAKAVGTTDFYDRLCAYKFHYPVLSIELNDVPSDDYGKQEEYLSGLCDVEELSYGEFYGKDDGKIFFSTKDKGKPNLLILGESYDNAILKLIACHFNDTYAVDLRYYKSYMGKEFSLSSYIDRHKIDKVLFIGNLDYFISEDFDLED